MKHFKRYGGFTGEDGMDVGKEGLGLNGGKDGV